MKRWMYLLALVALALVFSAGAALAEEGRAIVLPMSDGCVLIASDGQSLTARGAYEDICSISREDVPPEDELFLATPTYDEEASGLSLLMNSKGEALTDPVYDFMQHEGSVVRYYQDGLQGTMDLQLSPIVPCEYYILSANGEGGYLGLDSDPYDDKPDGVYYIDPSGVETATGARIISGLGNFSEGLCTATSAESGRVGYLDAMGNWAIAPQLEYGGDFKNGRAEACLESGYGIIDATGNWLLTPKYTLVSTGFGDGNMILASENNRVVHLIDPRNYQVKKSFQSDEIYFGTYFDRNYVVLYTSDSVQLIDEDGNVLMETAKDGNFSVRFEMGDRVIKRTGAWGELNTYLMDLSGEEIAGPYRELALLDSDGESTYFTFSDFDTQQQADSDQDFVETWEVPDSRRDGVIDQDGEVTIDVGEFSRLDYTGRGYLIAETQESIGLVDFNGQWLAQFPKDTRAQSAEDSLS